MALTRPKLTQFVTTVASLSDPITVLKAGTAQANIDIGFLMNRANGLVSNVALYWNEQGNTFVTAFTANTGLTDTNVTATSYANVTTGHHLPGANVTYNLGSSTQRWKDLWLSGTTIYLGGGTITAPTGAVTITNDAGGSFSVTGSVSGQASGTFGNLIANSGAISTSTTTGALQVIGGAGITGNLNIGGNLTVTGNLAIIGNITSVNYETVTNTEYVSSLIATTVNAATIGNASATFSGASATLTGTVIASTVNAATIGNTGATLTGTLQTAAQTNITSVGTLTSLAVGAVTSSGTIIASTLNAATIGNTGATLTGTLQTASQPNITGVGTITSGTWSSSFGAVSGANLTNLTAANLLGTAPTANVSLYDSVTALTTNQTFYPQFSNIATTGNTIMGVSPSLAFNPSTGTLNATTVVASTVNAATIGNASATISGASATLTGTVIASTVNAATIGNTGALLTGTLQTASQPNITGVGTITSGTWSSSFGAVSGANLTNLTAANLLGTAPTANVSLYDTVTALTTNQTFYPQFSNIATTGNTIMGVSPSLAFNPGAGSGTLNVGTLVTGTVNAATIGNSGATLTGTVSTASQPSITTLAGLTSFGTAGVTTTAQGNLTIAGNLTVNGNSVSIGASTLSITDPIINLNTPSDLTPLSSPTTSDIGLKFHYYDSADSAAFLGRENSSSTLVWYSRGTDTANVFTGTVLGNVKIGSMLIANTTTSTTTTTGALQVAGGAGIAGNVISGGYGQFGGLFNENSTTVGVYAGYLNSSPRIGFFNGTAAQNWQIDNNSGTFRWYTPGVTRMQLDATGNLTVYGNVIQSSPHIITSNIALPALQVIGTATKGGAGYHDFLSVTNQGGGTNPNKYFRLDSAGTLQIIDSAYSSNIFNLTNAGNLTIPGAVTVNALYTTTGLFWAGNNNVISTGGGGSAPAGTTGQVQYNNGGTLGASGLYYYSANSAILATGATASTSETTGQLQVLGGLGVTGNVWAGQVYSTNNGNGTNYRIGDDAWLGDINVANTTRLMGAQDGTQGYLVFGNSNGTNYIGRSGTNPITVTGAFATTGNTDVQSTLYGRGVYDNGSRVISSVTVSAGTGMSGGGTITGASGTVTLTNAGVTGLSSSGTGNLTVSASTGSITVSLPATGPGAVTTGSSTAIPVITTDAYGRIASISTSSVSTTISLAGTSGTGSVSGGGTLTFASSNGITATASGSTITISSPQDLQTTASPTFANLTVANIIINTGGKRNNRNIVTNYTGNTAPSAPVMGDEWFRANTGVLYKYTFDNITNTNNWVDISSALYNASTSATASTLALRDSSGNLTANWFLGRSTSASYADLAEMYTADDQYGPATVVIFGGSAEITVTTESHDHRVAGVISTNPAYLMNSELTGGLPVAFTGRVPCMVRGPVTKGDLLVTSTTPGVAQRLDNRLFKPGCVIGKSLDSIQNNDIATIEVAVGRY